MMIKTADYRSVEQRIWDVIPRKEIGGFLEYFVKGLYGVVASLFRIPTLARKIRENQSLAYRLDAACASEIAEKGTMLGGTIGGLTDVSIFCYSLWEVAENNNYIPMAVLLGLNVASGLYELGRLGARKRNEGLEAKVEQQQ